MPHNKKKQLTTPEREEEILKMWERKKIFASSLARTKKGKDFVFYEGPPTANGMPGIHHVEARAFKDAVLRYKTMQGFHVPRRAGWDTHGLPVEIQVEKKLGFKTKHDIENYGIARFNAEAKKSVWEYKEVWEQLTKRMGFWVDMKRPYITYETTYIESLWWIIKEFWRKGLLYEDFKVVPWCPRCQTGLSSHEVGLGYKEVEDTAVYVKFKLEPNQKIGDFTTDDKTYILAWTTTPWTLPGNVGLAVKDRLEYILLVNPQSGERIIISKSIYLAKSSDVHVDIASGYWIDAKWSDVKQGNDLVGLEYEPLFDVPELAKSDAAYKIYAADFVSATEGTGVVHTAVMYGEDDYQLGKKVGLPTFHTVDETGHFVQETGKDLAGLSIATREDKQKTEARIIELLGDKIFQKQPYSHEYPHCWRCATPLLYYARKAWWVRTTAVKKELLANNEKINWVPDHLKRGRFGEFLRDVRDWCFSRERYWGTPLPIWRCDKCGEIEVVGSVAELKKRAGILPRDEKKQVDLHRPFVDEIFFECVKKDCRGAMRRTPEVADVWFDSGAMPFAQNHYPFNTKEKLAFPADYICEAVDQTRGWFYSMLAIATLLGRGTPYKNVISLGHVLDAKGEKMSKSRGNIVSHDEMIAKYGVDALRWYFFTINSPGDPKRFEEKDVALRQRGFVATLWNSFVFFDTYVAKVKNQKIKDKSKNILDRWILAKLNMLAGHVTAGLNEYDLVGAARAIDQFTVNDFSQWFVRRSRRRFQHPKSAQEKDEAAAVMAHVLLTLAELSAPFAPFVSEAVYQGLRKKMKMKEESVHLRGWPEWERKKSSVALDMDRVMKEVRSIVATALKLRTDAGIKVRQPLAKLQITDNKLQKQAALLDLIKDETNVKEIVFGNEMKLDTTLTPGLKEEGIVREIIRNIQEMRRELGLMPKTVVGIAIGGDAMTDAMIQKWSWAICKETNSRAAFSRAAGGTPRAERALQFEQGKIRVVIV